MSNMLDDYSPFQAGIGRFANFMNVPLSEEGYTVMRVYNFGLAEIYEDPLGHPILTLTPDDAAMLRNLADELESNRDAYAAWLKQKDTGKSEEEGEPEVRPLRKSPTVELPSEVSIATGVAGAKSNGKEPQTVLIAGADSKLQQWGLR